MIVLLLITPFLLGLLQTEQSSAVTVRELEQQQVRALVHLFGEQLVHVSLLAPAGDVERQMLEHYAPYVADDLLSGWLAEPESAPGRITSSPWPEGIAVNEIERLGNESYLVGGEISLVTSAEVAAGDNAATATRPLRMKVERGAGPWQITALKLGSSVAEEEKVSLSEPDWPTAETEPLTFRPPMNFRVIRNDEELPAASVPPCARGFTACAFYGGKQFEGSTFISAGVGARILELPESECESTKGNFAVVQNVRRESIGETSYLVFDTAEAAMNKVARDTVYRTWHDGSCFEFVARISSANIGVYEPGTIAEFTEAQRSDLRETLHEIVASVELKSLD